VFDWDALYVVSGEKSVGITSVYEDGIPCWYTQDFIAVDPSHYVYRYSVWYKYTDEPHDISNQVGGLAVSMYDQDLNLIAAYGLPCTYTDQGWHTLQWCCNRHDVFQNDTWYVRLELWYQVYADQINPAAGIRFDDIMFYQTDLSDNLPPAAPMQPTGPARGRVETEYAFTTATTDPEDDMMRYGWDWDGDLMVDTWTDHYYESGMPIETLHGWDEEGKFEIRAKAQDEVGGDSEWSEPLLLTMPRISIVDPLFLQVLDLLNAKFPFLFNCFVTIFL
jgi:hypothetical protein